MAKVTFTFDTEENFAELDIFQKGHKFRVAILRVEDELKRGRDQAQTEYEHGVYEKALKLLNAVLTELDAHP